MVDFTYLCPLCNNNKLSVIDTLNVHTLQKLYYNSLRVNIQKEYGEYKSITFNHCSRCDLMFFHPLISGSASFYEEMQEHEWYYQNEKAEFDFAAQYISKNDHILEVGCGTGAFSKIISVASYTGLEYNQKAIEKASFSGINVYKESLQTHATNNPSKYDIVCCFQVLEHIADLSNFIISAIECTKPNGKLIFSVPSADSFVKYSCNNATNMPPHHLSWWTDCALRSIAKIYNLDEVALHHEKLADIHRQWYIRVLLQKALAKIIGKKLSLINQSFAYKLIAKISSHFARLTYIGFKVISFRPRGHTVIAVYKKIDYLENKMK